MNVTLKRKDTLGYTNLFEFQVCLGHATYLGNILIVLADFTFQKLVQKCCYKGILEILEPVLALNMGAVTVYARGLKQRTRRTKEELYACARGLLPLYLYSGFRSISSSAGCFAAGADGLCTHGLGAILCKSPVPPGLARLKHHGKRSFLQRRELTVLLPVGRSHHGSVTTFLSTSSSKLQCALQGNASQAFSGVAADGHYRQLRITSFSYKDDVPHRFPASFVRWTSGERNNRESDNNKQKVVAHLSEGGGDDKDNESEHIVPWTGSDYDDDSKEEGRRQVGSSCGGQIEKGEQVSFIKESTQGDLGKEGKDAEYRALVARYKVVFQQRVLDWEDIPVSLEVFPYYLRYLFSICSLIVEPVYKTLTEVCFCPAMYVH